MQARVEGASELQELLQLAVQVGGIGIFESDLEGKRILFSPELCAILGLAQGTELNNAEAFRLLDKPASEAVKASNIPAKSPDQGEWRSVHRIVRPDGGVRWISVHGRRIFRPGDKNSQAPRVVGTVTDVTYLKETEAALRESELRLRLALDAAQMGTFEAAIAATDARIDAQAARLLGLPEKTRVIAADEIRKRISLEDLKASDAKKVRLTERHEAYHHEFRLLMPDGSERWLSARAAVRSNRIFGVSFDVTQRKRAEAALRESEARLRIATSGAALGVFEWDAKADKSLWENERMYEIFGRTPAEGPLNKTQFLEEYLHPDDVPAFEAGLKKAMQAGGHFHTVCRINRKNGALRWLQIDGKFEDAAPGRPPRLLGIVADITGSKRLAARAVRLSERLLTIQEEERRNIAQELHDSTVQHLVAASISLMNLKPKAMAVAGEDRSWNDLESCLGEAMKELRTFSYLMLPPALPGKGLGHSLRQYIDGFAERSGLVIKLRMSRKAGTLSLRQQRTIFRIVQEGLANAYRHASATRVSVALRRIGPWLHLIINDDGQGVTIKAKDGLYPLLRPGVGIRGIRMRLHQLGGRLSISRLRAGGTRLHAALPIDSRSRRKASGHSEALVSAAPDGQPRKNGARPPDNTDGAKEMQDCNT